MSSRRPRRAQRSQPAQDWDMGEEAQDAQQEMEEEPAPRRGRRPGKEPVEQDEEDYQPEEEDEERAGKQPAARRGRQSHDGGEAGLGGGPTQKRPRRGGAGAAGVVVKPEPGGDGAGPTGRRQQRGADAGGGGAADGRPTAGQLRAVELKIAEYRNVRDHAAARAQGKGVHQQAMLAAARAVVRYMLFAHSEKPGVPVKRPELVGVVTTALPNLKGGAKTPVTAYCIAYAQHYLADALGLEMEVVARAAARARDAALPGAEEGAPQYVLRSLVPPPLRSAFVLDQAQAPQRGLLMVVLSLLHLAGGKLDEEELYTQLEELAISRREPHPAFGDIPAQLKEFCTRRYIQAEKQQGAEGDVVLYRFAEQAMAPSGEIQPEEIKRFVEEQFAGGEQ
ncbi:melanoma-associated antigen G1 [Micractinium conductrix]|uniref:Melanoma-associated antigen G1 n=1 Tax=Micractinium conductrix TaxID=554055 RepID=A0A2P6VNV9_9CHLO|nr:melanoma-associated antigen G1 [Micractinium conductrix]|eukprot:PSC75792.1 melanoma-associated antigen G1 [Micractinium conductrix]